MTNMYLIDKLNNDIKSILNALGFDDEVAVVKSSVPTLGDYQYNGSMKLAGMNHMNPRELAEKIKTELEKIEDYTNINIAGPGFINISFKDEVLVDYLNQIFKDFDKNIYKDENNQTIFLDYGGANVAKELHVGHLRTANIGEALKRLLNSCNIKTIADVHLGDWGRPMGLVMLEIKKRMPELPYFDENYTGEYPVESPVSAEDLTEIYPTASNKSKEDPEYLEEARVITLKLQSGDRGYTELWKRIRKISVEYIKKTYDLLNTSFDLWEGEADADKEIPELLEYLEGNNYTEISEGAEVIFVNEPGDKKELPPFMIKKSNGGVIYDTTELATLYSRIKRFKFNDIWYLTDSRQELHFVQCFRAARKCNLVPEDMKLTHLSVGTMNGSDGKPFKTRDGGVMSLNSLYNLVYNECYNKLSDSIEDSKREETAKIIAIAAIKFADLLPNRTSDYIFDPVKFSDLNGKTGPYILYNTVRIKSIFEKVGEVQFDKYHKISSSIEREIILHLIELSSVLKKAISGSILNEICEFVFKLTSLYNTFYADHYIVSEENKETQESWLVLSDVVYRTNLFILNILGIEVPERM